jgi:hypothetical protein
MKVRVRESKGEIEESYGKYRSEYLLESSKRGPTWSSTYRNLNSITQNVFNTYEEAYKECIWFAESQGEKAEFIDENQNKKSDKLDKHYNWALIEDSNIKLFNNSTLNFSVLSTDALEDVSVEIDDKGVLCIEAKKIIYFFTSTKLWEDEWKKEPDPKLIKEERLSWFSTKVRRYVESGWIRTIEREKVKYIMTNYKIEILD